MKKQELLELIAKNELDMIFEVLLVLAAEKKRSDIEKELILLQAQDAQNQSNERTGIQSYAELNISKAKLRKALIEIVDVLFNNKKLQKNKTAKKTGNLKPLIFAGLIGLTLFLLGFIPIYKAEFQADVVIESLLFRPKLSLQIASDSDYLESFSISSVNSYKGLIVPMNNSAKVMDIEITGSSIQLVKLEIGAGAEISLGNDQGELVFFIESSFISSDLDVTGKYSVDVDHGRFQTTVEGEKDSSEVSLSFHAATESNVYLKFQKENVLIGQRFLTDNLEFTAEEIKNDLTSGLKSSIIEGVIEIEGKRDSLGKGDLLILNSKDIEIESLRMEGNYLHLKFNGMSNKIQVNRYNRTSSLKPNWLQYLGNSQQITFYGGILVWIIGVLWSIWRAYSGEK